MEREKIRMPAGALIACILVVVFMIACIAGIISWISGGGIISDNNDTQVQATDTPSISASHANNTGGSELPSSSLSYSGTQALVGEATTTMISKCMDSVVSIDITMQNGYTSVLAGSGSGVIITADGYIVTCNHVVEGAADIYVYLNDGTEYTAALVGNDSLTDLAVIKIEGSNLPYATIGNSSDLLIGNNVYAIGNALGELSNTVTDGIISGLDREIEVQGQSMTLLQTSAAINSGNSGGGLFLEDGSLVGIVNAKSSGTSDSGSTIEGLGFAIPVDIAKPVIADIMDYGFVTGRPYLGVSTQDVTYGAGFFSYYSYPSVVSVTEGSAADIAGIQVNDIITAVNGVSISSSNTLRQQINSFKVGDTITITVMRGNKTVDISVTLLERTA